MTPLQKAAQAVIDRWISAGLKNTPHNAEYIAKLGRALDAEIADAVEPVAVFNGLVDSGEHGAFNLDMLKMIPRGAPLYLHPPQPQATTVAAWKAEQIDDYEIRVTSPEGESWRLRSADKNDIFNNFIWRWAKSMITTQGEKP